MAQALEKMNMSPSGEKWGFLAEKWLYFHKFHFWRNPVFSKVLNP